MVKVQSASTKFKLSRNEKDETVIKGKSSPIRIFLGIFLSLSWLFIILFMINPTYGILSLIVAFGLYIWALKATSKDTIITPEMIILGNKGYPLNEVEYIGWKNINSGKTVVGGATTHAISDATNKLAYTVYFVFGTKEKYIVAGLSEFEARTVYDQLAIDLKERGYDFSK